MIKKILLGLSIAAIAGVAIAQQPGIKRTPLQKLDFPAGYNTVTAIAEVPAGGAAGGNFRDRGDRVVAGREVEFLQRRALDAGLLRDGNTGARDSHDGQSEQKFFDHAFSPCRKSLAALAPCWKRPRRLGTYRLIPSKLAAMPRWNSDQSKPSANAT